MIKLHEFAKNNTRTESGLILPHQEETFDNSKIICVAGHCAAGKTFAAKKLAQYLNGSVINGDEVEDYIMIKYPEYFEAIYNSSPKNIEQARNIRRNGTAEQDMLYHELILPLMNNSLKKRLSSNDKLKVFDWAESPKTDLWLDGVLIESPRDLRIKSYSKRHNFKKLDYSSEIIRKREIIHGKAVQKASTLKYIILNNHDESFEEQIYKTSEDIIKSRI